VKVQCDCACNMVLMLRSLLLVAAANGEMDVAVTTTSVPVEKSGRRRRTFGAKPHIVFLFCDNVGWANVGFHRPPDLPENEIHSPNIDELAYTGLILDRHYTYKFCSPSRSSVMTGRLPIHVNIYNDDITKPGGGVDPGFTMIAARLQEVGYITHMIGKWHLGMANKAHLPMNRGFNTSLHYFDSGNNYYDQTAQVTGCYYYYDYYSAEAWPVRTDLWDTDKPARHLNGTNYEELLFAERALDIIDNHPLPAPLFLYYAIHSSCTGQTPEVDEQLQPLPRMYEKFSHIDDPDRRANAAMIALMDEAVGNITQHLKVRGMWENTLVLWSSDNGGAVHLAGGANSYPLRGGYLNNWEGGIRVAALLNGGFLPNNRRGKVLEGFIHEADWYATFCHLAGINPHDKAAKKASLPPIDSLNMWDLISGSNKTSPRYEFSITPVGEDIVREDCGGDAAYMMGGYKLIVGFVLQDGWTGQVHPNLSAPWDSYHSVQYCTRQEINKLGCLFDVMKDPSERNDLALEMPQKVNEIYAAMMKAQETWFNPDRGTPDPKACRKSRRTGFWQPWLHDDGSTLDDNDINVTV